MTVPARSTSAGHRPPAKDLYHFLLVSSWWRLLAVLIAVYVGANTVFALLYVRGGDGIENARPGSFVDAFFFSVQTMATIGYGKMVPRSLYANVLVSVEALLGLLGLAVVTGLVFAKFSRPTARVLFSRVAVVSERDGVPSLMFRMANERSNNIVEAQVHVVLARNEHTLEGEQVRRFYDLALTRRQSALFSITWTAVHPITEASPLHGQTPERLEADDAEVVVSLVGFDESFSQTVHARHTYRAAELAWGARFADIIVFGPAGQRHVEYAHFHDVIPPVVVRPRG